MADNRVGRKRFWRYFWIVSWNLARIAIVWLLFTKFTERFEVVVLGILVLVYSQVNFSFRNFERNLAIEGQAYKSAFLRILRRLGEDAETIQEQEEELKEQAKSLRDTNAYWTINIFGGLLIDVYAAWKVLAGIFT